MVQDKIGIGFIGTGFARKVQMPAFAACGGARLVSVSSGTKENAAAAASEFGIEHASGDWRETASHPDVDLIVITTPPIHHLEMALAAIDAGKHILAEKPMAMNTAEAETMRDAAALRPIMALIDHELRFQPGRQLAFTMLRDGAIGRVRHAKAIFQAPHRGDPTLPWNWWSDKAQGGGALGAIVSHVIDSFHWFLGVDITSVSCQLHSNIKERMAPDGEIRPVTSDDEAMMLLRFADGELTDDATGLVSVSMTEGPAYRNRMEFYGAEGVLRIDHRGEVLVCRNGEHEWSSVTTDIGSPIAGVPDTGFARAFHFFAPILVAALLRGERVVKDAATFDDGVRVQRVLDACRVSDSESRSVFL